MTNEAKKLIPLLFLVALLSIALYFLFGQQLPIQPHQ